MTPDTNYDIMTNQEIQPGGMMKLRLYWALWVFAAIFLAGGPALTAPDWVKTSQVDFPAKVRSMTFLGGDVMDQFNSVCWGKWCLKTDPNTSIATYRCVTAACHWINIDGIVCQNSAFGRQICRMIFQAWPSGGYRCDMSSSPNLNPSIRIKCPQKVVFE